MIRNSTSFGHIRHIASTNDFRDLSRAPTLDAFLKEYSTFIQNCTSVLEPHGKLVILMGDYIDSSAGFIPLTYHNKQIAFAGELKSHCTDIIRFGMVPPAAAKFIAAVLLACMTFESSLKERRGK